jgi:hypothetical protein
MSVCHELTRRSISPHASIVDAHPFSTVRITLAV